MYEVVPVGVLIRDGFELHRIGIEFSSIKL